MLGSNEFKMAKLTLEEKRRQSIYRQLYGKQTYTNPVRTEKAPDSKSSTSKVSYQITPAIHTQVVTDTKYLKSDLLKVFVLSSAAIVIQLVLFLAQKNHLINLF